MIRFERFIDHEDRNIENLQIHYYKIIYNEYYNSLFKFGYTGVDYDTIYLKLQQNKFELEKGDRGNNCIQSFSNILNKTTLLDNILNLDRNQYTDCAFQISCVNNKYITFILLIISEIILYYVLNDIFITRSIPEDVIKNKFIVIGPGNNYDQIVPDFYCDQINGNENIYYDVIICEPGEQGSAWGSPTYDGLNEIISRKINKYKRKNIRIFVLNFAIDSTFLDLFYLLFTFQSTYSQCIIVDTKNTAQRCIDLVKTRDYDLRNIFLMDIADVIRLMIESNKIVFYDAVGSKFGFNNRHVKKYQCGNIPASITPPNNNILNYLPLRNILENSADNLDLILEAQQEETRKRDTQRAGSRSNVLSKKNRKKRSIKKNK